MLDNYSEILTVKDVCEILHIERKLVYKLIQKGDISALKVGSVYRIPKRYLVNYIDNKITPIQ